MIGRRSALGRLLGVGAGAAMAPQVLGGMPANVPTPPVPMGGPSQWIGDYAKAENPRPLSEAAMALRKQMNLLDMRMSDASTYRSTGLDPDIASLESVSWASKVRMQRQRIEEVNTLRDALASQFRKLAGW